MGHIITIISFCFVLFMTSINPLFAREPIESRGDASSDSYQRALDEEDIARDRNSQVIENDNFDLSDGGLYCPDNDCDDDPSDAANGF